jgi:glycosyltransferase involved in cell wall biosynthesis
MMPSDNSKPRILIASGIFQPDIGGPASYGRALADKLSDSHSVTLVTYSSVWNFADDKKEKFKVIRVWNKTPRGLRHLIYFLKVFFRIRKVDVVLALNAVSAGLPAMMAARFFKKKFFVKIVGDYAWEIAVNSNRTPLLINDFQKSKKKGKIKRLAKIQTWIAKKADKVIVPSEYLKTIVTGWGVPAEHIAVIYNGTNFKKADITSEEARVKIGIPGSVILSVGRLVPWKGFKMLIKIMPQLLELNQFFRLVIVGDGPERRILETMARNLRLDKKIYIVGGKSSQDLKNYLAAADIFVLNTGYEGFSHQIMEAMTAGVPVVTTAVGGNREIINQGENGFMVRYNDEFNLIEAVKTIWRDKELREHFIEEGKKTVEKFSFEKMLEQTKNLLIS